MRQLLRAGRVAGEADAKDDPFRYGWRYVRRTQPDGTEVVDQVPLSLDDLLYPAEGDFVVQEPIHRRDFFYCHSTLEGFYAAQPSVVVLGDCRVDWVVAGVRPLGPDIVVLFDVHQWLRRGTFHLAEEGGRPVLVVEIASPSTRGHDLGIKLDLYHQVGVQKYVIVDRGPQGDAPVQLLGYQCNPTGWEALPLDAQGRLDLAPVGLLLGSDAGGMGVEHGHGLGRGGVRRAVCGQTFRQSASGWDESGQSGVLRRKDTRGAGARQGSDPVSS